MRITDTMTSFVAGESRLFLESAAAELKGQWYQFAPGSLSSTFALLWSGYEKRWSDSSDSLLDHLIGERSTLDRCRFERVQFLVGSGGRISRSFSHAVLIECSFDKLDLSKTAFSDAWLESTSFAGADLTDAVFARTSVLDVDFSGAILTRADFREVDTGISISVEGKEYSSERALGYLAFAGALIPEVDPIYIAMASPKFEIAQKIARELVKPGPSQYLGLTQRGASAKDPEVAKEFVNTLVAIGYAQYDRSGAARTVEIRREGRVALLRLAEGAGLDTALQGFLRPRER